MKKSKRRITCIVLSIALINIPYSIPYSFAHGVEAISEGAGGTAIRAVYDGGEAMSYAKVTISAPDSKTVFQTGRSDRNGRFCFFPDVPGIWKVVMEDGIGHRLEMAVNADQAQKAHIKQPESSGLNKMGKVLFGISLIFFMASLLIWLNAKKILRQTAGK